MKSIVSLYGMYKCYRSVQGYMNNFFGIFLGKSYKEKIYRTAATASHCGAICASRLLYLQSENCDKLEDGTLQCTQASYQSYSMPALLFSTVALSDLGNRYTQLAEEARVEANRAEMKDDEYPIGQAPRFR